MVPSETTRYIVLYAPIEKLLNGTLHGNDTFTVQTQLQHLIGRGKYSTVYAATHKPTNLMVAMKKVLLHIQRSRIATTHYMHFHVAVASSFNIRCASAGLACSLCMEFMESHDT